MSRRILTPRGWRELEELEEHKANKPHKHPHKPYGPFQPEEKEEVKEGPFSSKSDKAGIGDVAPGVRNMGKKSKPEYAFPKSRPGLKDMKKGTTKTNEDTEEVTEESLGEELDALFEDPLQLREDLLGKHGQHRDEHQKKSDHYAGVAQRHKAGGDHKGATNASALSKAHGNAAMAHAKVIDQHKTGDRMKAANASRPAFKVGQAAHAKEKQMQSDQRV